MTLAEMKMLTKDSITVKEAAEVIGCAPQLLRDGLDMDDDRPIHLRRYMFPHCKAGNRHSIMRQGFIEWCEGRIKVDVTVSHVS